MNPTTHMLIQSYFKQLKMPQASKVYQSMAREAEDNNLSYDVNGHLRILIFGHENSPCELK